MTSESRTEPTLFTRIGGQSAVQLVVDDFVVRISSHPQVGRFFARLDTSAGSKFRSHLVNFICAAIGGNSRYSGRDMASAHRAINISEADWDVTVGNLKESLEQARVPAREIQELVGVIAPLKPQIVKRS